MGFYAGKKCRDAGKGLGFSLEWLEEQIGTWRIRLDNSSDIKILYIRQGSEAI